MLSSTPEKKFGIYTVEKPTGKANNFLENLIWGNQRRHSYLCLMDESSHRVIAELHFFSRTKDKKYPLTRTSNLYYAADYFACALGLQKQFSACAEKMGLDKYQLYLTPFEKPVDKPKDPKTMKLVSKVGHNKPMEDWARACESAAITVNNKIPYSPIGNPFRPAVNCRSGTVFVLNRIGYKFEISNDAKESPFSVVGASKSLASELSQAGRRFEHSKTYSYSYSASEPMHRIRVTASRLKQNIGPHVY